MEEAILGSQASERFLKTLGVEALKVESSLLRLINRVDIAALGKRTIQARRQSQLACARADDRG